MPKPVDFTGFSYLFMINFLSTRGKIDRFLEKSKEWAKAETPHGIDDGILIDSFGLPNAIRFSLTAANNHNGMVSEEARLIYVVQQRSGLPLFFRYVAGNVIGVSTLARTIAELKANSINTKFAILDAGYYGGVNADVLAGCQNFIHNKAEKQL